MVLPFRLVVAFKVVDLRDSRKSLAKPHLPWLPVAHSRRRPLSFTLCSENFFAIAGSDGQSSRWIAFRICHRKADTTARARPTLDVDGSLTMPFLSYTNDISTASWPECGTNGLAPAEIQHEEVYATRDFSWSVAAAVPVIHIEA